MGPPPLKKESKNINATLEGLRNQCFAVVSKKYILQFT